MDGLWQKNFLHVSTRCSWNAGLKVRAIDPALREKIEVSPSSVWNPFHISGCTLQFSQLTIDQALTDENQLEPSELKRQREALRRRINNPRGRHLIKVQLLFGKNTVVLLAWMHICKKKSCRPQAGPSGKIPRCSKGHSCREAYSLDVPISFLQVSFSYVNSHTWGSQCWRLSFWTGICKGWKWKRFTQRALAKRPTAFGKNCRWMN